MSKRFVFLSGVFTGVLIAGFVGVVLAAYSYFPASDKADPERLAPRFPNPIIHTKRQYLSPVLPDDEINAGLILTSNATGSAAMMVEKSGNERGFLTAWVAYQHLSDANAAAAVAFTLGMALKNWKTFALLIVDGEVVDEVVCWQCDVHSPDFEGADLGNLLSNARPVQLRRQSFDTAEAFEDALGVANADPLIVIHDTKEAYQTSQGAPLKWSLETWVTISG